MRRLLLTGFDPFGGEGVNPAWEAVSRLPWAIDSWQVERLQIPTAFSLAAQRVCEAADAFAPEAILCVGQAGGRARVTPEMVAINLRHASIADNCGCRPQDEPVVPGGPAAYFSTLPVRRMVEEIRREDLPAEVSYSAGAYVCNDLFYSLSHRYAGGFTRVGFIHVPYLPEQAKNGAPSMPLSDIVRALTAAIRAI